MASGRKIQRNQPNATSAPQTGMFQPRPFAAPTQSEAASPQAEQTPDVQAKESQPTSDRLSRVDFAAPPPIQPKLSIGAPGDKYEQEADTIARKVVMQIQSPVNPAGETVQRQTPMLSIQPKLSFPAPSIQRQDEEATPDLESSISRAKSSGSPLDNAIRPKMEGAFGADFSGVRVHTDANSDTLNRSISARAFTTGQHIFFKKGEYNPGSSGGQELLAHELTHVVQQSGSKNELSRSLQRQPLSTVPANQTVIQCDPDEEKQRKRQEKFLSLCQGQIKSRLGYFSTPPKNIYDIAVSGMNFSITDANLMMLPLQVLTKVGAKLSPGDKDEIQLMTDIGSAVITIVISSNPLLAGVGIAFAFINYINAKERQEALRRDREIEISIARRKEDIIAKVEKKLLARQEALIEHSELDDDSNFVNSNFGPLPVWGYAYLSQITYKDKSLEAISYEFYQKECSPNQRYWIMLGYLGMNENKFFNNPNDPRKSSGESIISYFEKVYKKSQKLDLIPLMEDVFYELNKIRDEENIEEEGEENIEEADESSDDLSTKVSGVHRFTSKSKVGLK